MCVECSGGREGRGRGRIGRCCRKRPPHLSARLTAGDIRRGNGPRPSWNWLPVAFLRRSSQAHRSPPPASVRRCIPTHAASNRICAYALHSRDFVTCFFTKRPKHSRFSVSSTLQIHIVTLRPHDALFGRQTCQDTMQISNHKFKLFFFDANSSNTIFQTKWEINLGRAFHFSLSSTVILGGVDWCVDGDD